MASREFLKRALVPASVFLAVSLVLLFPIFKAIGNIGVSDWDSQLFYHGASVKTILEYGQFPLWNPYHCGGNTMLASPEISYLAPPFIFALLFGEVVGVKFIILVYTLLGLWGMYFLSRTLGYGRLSSYLPPIVYMLSSWYALRITEGHTGFLPFALLPFIAAFYLKSMEGYRLRNSVIAGFFLAWTILAGGVYPFTVTALFLSVFCLLSMISRKSLAPALNLFLIVLFAFLLSAVKSLPQLEFISDFPRKTEQKEFHSAEILKDSLFSRNQRVTTQGAEFYKGAEEESGAYLKAFWGGERPWGWQEYGAFTGIGAFALYIAGFAFPKRLWPWLILSIFTLLVSLGDFSPVNIWSLLKKLPVFGSLHGSSRVMALFIFSAAVISGYVLTRIEGWRGKLGKTLAALITAAVFFELLTVSMPVLYDAFTEAAPKAEANDRFMHLVVASPTSTNYPYFLNNIGVLNCYESQHPPTKATPYGDDTGRKNPGYRGEVYLSRGNGTAALKYFSPNKVIAEVNAHAADKLVLNQNYFKGWKANDEAAISYFGLVAKDVGPETRQVVFRYMPESFRVGLIVSLISLVVSILIVVGSYKR